MRRVPELDALRGISALMVMGLHLGLGRSWSVLGSAVDLFFVLSGYLITGIVVRHVGGRGFFTAFCARRALRIWPIYFLTLIGLAIANSCLGIRQSTRGFWQALTFTQFVPRYWSDTSSSFCPHFNHTWTIAAEEQFYVLWPLLLLAIGRRSWIVTVPALIVSAFVARLFLYGHLLACVWDGFALGALLAWWLGGKPGIDNRRWPTVFLSGLLAATLSYPAWRGPIEAAIVATWADLGPRIAGSLNVSRLMLGYFAIVGLTIRLAGHPWLAPLRHPVPVYLGTISYGLYLYHFPIFVLISPDHYMIRCDDPMWIDALKIAASLAVAALSWRFVERPILRWKSRFAYPRPAASQPDAVRRPFFLRPPLRDAVHES